MAKYFDYSSRDMALRPDAGRYECGTLNTIGCYGLRASIDFLLEVGIENTAPAIQALGDRIHEGVTALGFETWDAVRQKPEQASSVSASPAWKATPSCEHSRKPASSPRRARAGFGLPRTSTSRRKKSTGCWPSSGVLTLPVSAKTVAAAAFLGGFPSTSSGFSENNDVLLRQHFYRLIETIALGLNLRPHLLDRHLVLRPDRHIRIFRAILQKHNPPTRL